MLKFGGVLRPRLYAQRYLIIPIQDNLFLYVHVRRAIKCTAFLDMSTNMYAFKIYQSCFVTITDEIQFEQYMGAYEH